MTSVIIFLFQNQITARHTSALQNLFTMGGEKKIQVLALRLLRLHCCAVGSCCCFGRETCPLHALLTARSVVSSVIRMNELSYADVGWAGWRRLMRPWALRCRVAHVCVCTRLSAYGSFVWTEFGVLQERHPPARHQWGKRQFMIVEAMLDCATPCATHQVTRHAACTLAAVVLLRMAAAAPGSPHAAGARAVSCVEGA